MFIIYHFNLLHTTKDCLQPSMQRPGLRSPRYLHSCIKEINKTFKKKKSSPRAEARHTPSFSYVEDCTAAKGIAHKWLPVGHGDLEAGLTQPAFSAGTLRTERPDLRRPLLPLPARQPRGRQLGNPRFLSVPATHSPSHNWGGAS